MSQVAMLTLLQLVWISRAGYCASHCFIKKCYDSTAAETAH